MLPARPLIGDNEALDSYLERVMVANGLETAGLTALATPAAVDRAWAFAVVDPHPALLQSLTRLTGVGTDELSAATLQRFSRGHPLDLTDFDRHRPAAFRSVSARGWFPLQGTQACPACIHETGQWDLRWRLPHAAVCLRHRSYLLPACVGCGRRFRQHRHTLLRPLDGADDHRCGNPLGPRKHCPHPVDDHAIQPAPAAVLQAATRITDACHRRPQPVWSELLPAADYLTAVRSLAVMLTHIATHAAPTHAQEWSARVRREAEERRTELRGPRWGIRPPDAPHARGHALAEADQILSTPSIDEAAAMLSVWTRHIPNTQSGPAGWVRNRTPASPEIRDLVACTLRPRQSPFRQITPRADVLGLPDYAIPQVIAVDPYKRTLGQVITASDVVGRRFASLCLAKLNRPGRSWADAARILGYPPDTGRRTSRAASQKLLVPVCELSPLIEELCDELRGGPDYRQRERGVQGLADTPEQWFPTWAKKQAPRRRARAIPYAITWMWVTAALGDLGTSPAWPHPPTARQKDAYRAFASRLDASAARDLDVLTGRLNR